MSLKKLNDSLVSLKSAATGTCTFSIQLYDLAGNGWNGNTANVSVNGNLGLSSLTLSSGSKSDWFDFEVSNSSSISVNYFPLGVDYNQNSYALTFGPSGTGGNLYNSLPFLNRFPNKCKFMCPGSVKLLYNGGQRSTNNLSVFSDGYLIVNNLSLDDTESIKIANFDIWGGSVMQISFYFDYQGSTTGYFPYSYQIFNSYGGSGTMISQFQIGVNGPSTPANINNLCSKNLYLTISSPEITNSSKPFFDNWLRILVTPSYEPNSLFQVNVTLTCGNQSLSQIQLSSYSVFFRIPDSFDQNCVFSASSNDPLVPKYADANYPVFLGYHSTIISPADESVFNYGQSIPLLVVTDNPDPVNITVILSCDDSEDLFIVTTGILTMINSTTATAGSCFFYGLATSDANTRRPTNYVDIIFRGSVSIIVPVSEPKLIIEAGSSTAVTLSFFPETVSNYVDMVLTCSSDLNTSDSTDESENNFDIPSDFYGNDCVFSIESDYYVSNNTVAITVLQPSTLSISLPTTSSYHPAGYPTQTLVIMDSLPAFQYGITAELLCDSSTLPASVPLTTGITENTTFPYNLYGSCTISVSNLPSPLTSPQPVSFFITPSLVFGSLLSSTSLTYGQAVTLLVESSDPSGAQYTASFSCFSGIFQVTGLNTGVSYKLVPAGIYGNVVVTVTATNLNSATMSFSIVKPEANIPPSSRNARSPYYTFVYAHMKDGNELVIIGTNQPHDASEMN